MPNRCHLRGSFLCGLGKLLATCITLTQKMDLLLLPSGGQGWVTVEGSTTGILKVLEDGRPLNGRWYAFSGDEIPW